MRQSRTVGNHSRTGRPLGDDTFRSKVETYLGHRLPRYGRGRPKGSKDSRPRKAQEEGKTAPG